MSCSCSIATLLHQSTECSLKPKKNQIARSRIWALYIHWLCPYRVIRQHVPAHQSWCWRQQHCLRPREILQRKDSITWPYFMAREHVEGWKLGCLLQPKFCLGANISATRKALHQFDLPSVWLLVVIELDSPFIVVARLHCLERQRLGWDKLIQMVLHKGVHIAPGSSTSRN